MLAVARWDSPTFHTPMSTGVPVVQTSRLRWQQSSPRCDPRILLTRASFTYRPVLQLYVERQKLSLKGETKAFDDNATGVRDRGKLVVKDLGPQVSWRTVFVTEYVRFFFASSLAYD